MTWPRRFEEGTMMRSIVRTSLIAAAASFLATVGAAAQSDNPPDRSGWTQHWAADHQALLNAKLAGLKAGLQLTPDQEKLWGPFEAAVRNAAEMRMQHMRDAMQRMGKMRMEGMDHPGHMDDMGTVEGGRESPLDRLDAVADRLTEGGAALKKVANSGKPLYASLDDQQKRVFGLLAREMMRMDRSGEMGPPSGPHQHASHDGDWGEEEE
jgi:LTXXQ motif family protein